MAKRKRAPGFISSIREYGYAQDTLLTHLEDGLKTAAADFRRKTGLAFTVYANAHEDGGLVWGYDYQNDNEEILRFAASLEDLVFALHAGYFAARGFVLAEDRKQNSYSLAVDYAALAIRDKPRLADLARSFRELAWQHRR